jgi:hypothetical protein
MQVTVILPLYNKAAFVRRALDSIANQTYTDWEAIVVDDGSTDDSAKIAAEYVGKKFRIIQQRNAGPGAARNRGLKETNTEFVAFLDGDDCWLPEYLEHGMAIHKASDSPLAAVTSGYFEMPAKVSRESMWRSRGLQEGLQQISPQTTGMHLHYQVAYMSSWSTIARTDAVIRWDGFYDKYRCLYGEDAALWVKFLLNERVAFSFRPLVNFDRGGSALSGNLKDARPLEPFLLDPDVVLASTPQQLLPLAKSFLAIRAAKAATTLGYWGRWREGRSLFQQYRGSHDWSSRFTWMGAAGATPLAGLLGAGHRALATLLHR